MTPGLPDPVSSGSSPGPVCWLVATGVVVALSGAAPAVFAATQASELSEVVVTATRTSMPAFDVPASVDRVGLEDPRNAALGLAVSEYVATIPGVFARSTEGFGGEESISIRGFGARSAFGARGFRLYTDGIPATFPDGQGQVGNFRFGSAERIEVLRGPFSALYGNSSGGVIQVFTAAGEMPSTWRLDVGGGSHGSGRISAGLRGAYRDVGYNVDLMGFKARGPRENARDRRTTGNARVDYDIGENDHLTFLASVEDNPLHERPLGLTSSQLRENRRQAAPSSVAFNVRTTTRQWQGGLAYRHDIGDHQSLGATVYHGERKATQVLAVPVVAQKNPLSGGGANDLAFVYSGMDTRWHAEGEVGSWPFDVTAGVTYDRLANDRRGYENFAGERIGVFGELRRDERDLIASTDEYVQGTLNPHARLSVTLGARHSSVVFDVDDRFVSTANPDDSGRVRYGATNPVAGLLFHVSPGWNVHASWSRGFETPTFIELAYRPDGSSGLNLGLRPARSSNLEVGSKWRFGNGGAIDLAYFDARSRDEIGVASSLGGRTTYQNIGRTDRRGVEAGLRLPLGLRWRLDASYTLLDARFRTDFGNCGAVEGCEVRSGMRMPGVPGQWFAADLRWNGTSGWYAGAGFSASSGMYVNDANTMRAAGYVVADANAGFIHESDRYRIRSFVRVDNVLGRDYVGSVIVNQAVGASFIPAAGRSFWVGVSVTANQ